MRTKFRFGAKRPLLIKPHGPKPLTQGSASRYLSTWLGHPTQAPPSWQKNLLQDKATFKMDPKKPSLSDVAFGKKAQKKADKKKEKKSKDLRKKAKKMGVKVTMKKGKSKVYKSDKTLKKHMKMKKKSKK